MKIPIKWLSEYVGLKGLSDVETSNSLTMSGTENEIVKGVDFPSIVVGEIKEIADHPDADRLHITKTDVGKANGGVLQIVCGAPNIEVGQRVPVALVGALIGEFEIKKAKIRGVESNGMLCSESELGISEDHDGIMILDPRAKVGSPLGEALNIGGTVLEAEITPNRSDCFSMIGIASEAAASLNRKNKSRNFNRAEIKSKKMVDVKVVEKKLCPRYITKVVEGIKIGPSPSWMRERLEASGIRPINNVVDVTNYVMLEWGQPMHAYDLTKVSGAITVRKAKKGENIVTLDGVSRDLVETDLVIADAKGAIGIAGVMGGLNSEVDEKTRTVVLEAAVFEGTTVRKTAQRLGLRTEASNRFEKGLPLGLPELAIERAAGLLTEIPGGLAGETPVVKPIAGANTDVQNGWIWIQHVGLPLHRVKDFLGVEIPTDRTIAILKSLGFEVEEFDFKKEARKHIGKPYVFGASFKTHGDLAFDCSYLTDYIYSKVGKFIGYTSLAQFELGTPVEISDLRPGDLLFVKGHIDKSVIDHYFVPDGHGGYTKVELSEPKEVGHNGIYIGDGRVVHARHYQYDKKTGRWIKNSAEGKVVEEDMAVFTENPEFLGARRYVAEPTGWLAVTAPWWRLDVKIEEDLLEEIGRIYGYENIPGRLPEGKLPVYEPNTLLEVSDRVKQLLSGAGYSEVYNYSFISAKNLTAVHQDPKTALRVANPISPEQEYMRLSLVPSLLKNIAVNQFNFEAVKIFEIASTYWPEKGEELPREETQLGIAVRSVSKKPGASFFEAKGVVQLLAQKLKVKNIQVEPVQVAGANVGQAIKMSGKQGVLATVYVPDAKVRKEFGIKTEMAIALLDINALYMQSERALEYRSVSRYPQVSRDVNLVFDQAVKASEIEVQLRAVGVKNVRQAEIIDIYSGLGLPENKKSVTIRLVFGASDHTLTEDEITGGLNQIVLNITKKLSATLRA